MKLYYQSRNDFKNHMLTRKFLIILPSAECPSPSEFECVGLDEWDLNHNSQIIFTMLLYNLEKAGFCLLL